MVSDWQCHVCLAENSALNDLCRSCKTEYQATKCCNTWLPITWAHPKVGGCWACMSVALYKKRIAMITNIYEARAWQNKHLDEIQARAQDEIEEIMNVFYDRWML